MRPLCFGHMENNFLTGSAVIFFTSCHIFCHICCHICCHFVFGHMDVQLEYTFIPHTTYIYHQFTLLLIYVDYQSGQEYILLWPVINYSYKSVNWYHIDYLSQSHGIIYYCTQRISRCIYHQVFHCDHIECANLHLRVSEGYNIMVYLLTEVIYLSSSDAMRQPCIHMIMDNV